MKRRINDWSIYKENKSDKVRRAVEGWGLHLRLLPIALHGRQTGMESECDGHQHKAVHVVVDDIVAINLAYIDGGQQQQQHFYRRR